MDMVMDMVMDMDMNNWTWTNGHGHLHEHRNNKADFQLFGALTKRPRLKRPSNVSTPSECPPNTMSKCSLRPL